MADFENFEQLDQEVFFSELISEHFEKAWDELTGQVGVRPLVNSKNVKLAFDTYHTNLEEVRVRLESQNPDHYKRAACLLDALNRAKLIQDVEVDGQTMDALEGNTAHGLSYEDCQYRLKFVKFVMEGGNEALAFDLAFRCCQVYEEDERPYTPNYFENMRFYLESHEEQNVDSLYMILKSYWFS